MRNVVPTKLFFHDVAIVCSDGGLECKRGSAISFTLCGFELICDQEQEFLDFEEEEVGHSVVDFRSDLGKNLLQRSSK